MRSPHVSGIVSTANDGNATWLPLASLAAHIFITDVSSRTILSQTYIYNGPIMLAEAYYVFPVPARAAVCSFRMQTNEGVMLEGVVKEISDAEKDYEQAISENRLAGLLEQYQQDIFVVSIGSLQPNTTVTVVISYVMDMSDNDQDDTIRYQLPSHVAGRYGAPSTSILYPLKGTVHRARLSITADIQMSGNILHVESNYNLVDMLLPPIRRNPAGCIFHVTRRQFNSDDVSLNKNFLLIVQAIDLDISRCIAECDGASTALSLTIVPQFQSTRFQDREYLFLIDRSGSMLIDNKLQKAKDALMLLLRSLPAEHSWFNVYSFDQNYQTLWTSGSRPYDDIFFRESFAYVEAIQVDQGGTELIPALEHVISTRNWIMPTSVFVLTDGLILDVNTATECVRQAAKSAAPEHPFRVFTLGVGGDASTELCEGLASAGNGECFMTLDGEDISSKCVRILGGMKSSMVEDPAINWGIHPGGVQQAPFQLSLSPNKRLSVTAILPRGQPTPSHVILTGRLTDDSLIEYRVPVTPAFPLQSSLVEEILGVPADLPPLIHTLAAHRLILDYERELATARRRRRESPPAGGGGSHGTSSPASTASCENSSSQSDATSSAHRSWPDNSPTNNRNHTSNNPSTTAADASGGPQSRATSPSTRNNNGNNDNRPGSPPSGRDRGHGSQIGTPASSHRSSSPGASGMPGAFKSWPPSRQQQQSPNDVPSAFFFQTSASEPDELLYLFGGNIPPVLCIAPPLKHELVFVSWLKSLRSFLFRPRNGISNQASTTANQTAPPTMVNHDDPAFRGTFRALSDLQSLEGLYDIHNMDKLSQITGIPTAQILNPPSDVSSAIENTNNSIHIWATSIAVAFLREKFPSHWVTWKGLVRKSIQAGSRACGGDAVFNEIVTHAVALIH
ncbi:hypothetical protein BU17DRAFT_96585 [Hysterangium stoloniferum]|nr:hypothetical protein BU17DRAFT_96585 [Hysterangium stoloniferum]